jgi:hypothetical protein
MREADPFSQIFSQSEIFRGFSLKLIWAGAAQHTVLHANEPKKTDVCNARIPSAAKSQ